MVFREDDKNKTFDKPGSEKKTVMQSFDKGAPSGPAHPQLHLQVPEGHASPRGGRVVVFMLASGRESDH